MTPHRPPSFLLAALLFVPRMILWGPVIAVTCWLLMRAGDTLDDERAGWWRRMWRRALEWVRGALGRLWSWLGGPA